MPPGCHWGFKELANLRRGILLQPLHDSLVHSRAFLVLERPSRLPVFKGLGNTLFPLRNALTAEHVKELHLIQEISLGFLDHKHHLLMGPLCIEQHGEV